MFMEAREGKDSVTVSWVIASEDTWPKGTWTSFVKRAVATAALPAGLGEKVEV